MAEKQHLQQTKGHPGEIPNYVAEFPNKRKKREKEGPREKNCTNLNSRDNLDAKPSSSFNGLRDASHCVMISQSKNSHLF